MVNTVSQHFFTICRRPPHDGLCPQARRGIASVSPKSRHDRVANFAHLLRLTERRAGPDSRLAKTPPNTALMRTPDLPPGLSAPCGGRMPKGPRPPLPASGKTEKRRSLEDERFMLPQKRPYAGRYASFAFRMTSSEAAMTRASAHHCLAESTSPRIRKPNSAAAAGSRLMSTP